MLFTLLLLLVVSIGICVHAGALGAVVLLYLLMHASLQSQIPSRAHNKGSYFKTKVHSADKYTSDPWQVRGAEPLQAVECLRRVRPDGQKAAGPRVVCR